MCHRHIGRMPVFVYVCEGFMLLQVTAWVGAVGAHSSSMLADVGCM